MYLVGYATVYYLLSTAEPHNFNEPLTRLDALYFCVTVFSRVATSWRPRRPPERSCSRKTALEYGAVTTARADVDFVVTEHGVAALRGCSLGERARRMIAIAAPEHRPTLEFDLEEYDLASATE